jgi:alpha-tubulin suppressor-like RCC1 family protein
LLRGWGEVSDTRGVEDELLDIRYIASSYGAFLALRGDGTVVSWGDQNYGALAQSNLWMR